MITVTPTLRIAAITGLICFVLGTGTGLAIGWKLYHPEQVLETYKPAIVTDSGAVVLERKPDQPIPPEIKKAAKEVGGKVTRTSTVKLQPHPSKDSPVGCKCDPITVDIGTVDQGDGIRTVVTTDDAEIVGGTDNPLEPYTVAKETKWEVGLIVPAENYEGIGGYVSRKVGPFSVGVQAAKPYSDQPYTAMLTVGIRF